MPSTITKTEEIRNLSKLQQLFYSCKEPNVWHTCGRVSNGIEKRRRITLCSHHIHRPRTTPQRGLFRLACVHGSQWVRRQRWWWRRRRSNGLCWTKQWLFIKILTLKLKLLLLSVHFFLYISLENVWRGLAFHSHIQQIACYILNVYRTIIILIVLFIFCRFFLMWNIMPFLLSIGRATELKRWNEKPCVKEVRKLLFTLCWSHFFIVAFSI